MDLFGLAILQLRSGGQRHNVLPPTLVNELHRALEPITRQTLQHRFDPDQMVKLGVYWADYVQANPVSENEYLLTLFDDLKTFVSEAVARNMGLLVEAA